MKLKFSEDCLITRGYNRSIIVDTTRKKIESIPNSLAQFIMENDLFCINEIKEGYSDDDCVIIDEYIDFLLSNEYLYFINNKFLNNFPKIELLWDYPSKITNSIISFNKYSWKKNIEKIISLLDGVNCQYIEIRFIDVISEDDIESLMTYLENTRISTINLYIPYIEITSKTYDVLINNLRLGELILYNSPKEQLNKQSFFLTKQIRSTSKKLNDIFQVADISQFYPNLKLYSESQDHHTYFNRKLYFGINGEIKNAPECDIIFDYIDNITNIEEFRSVLKNSLVSNYWYVSKQQCDICKICEFRNICVDNRLPSQREDGSWYHKIECNYNPFICKWFGEENYLSIDEMGITSNKEGFAMDKENIDKINANIWNK